MVDAECGVLGLEWIEGRSVRNVLGGGAEDAYEDEKEDGETDDNMDEESCSSASDLSNLGMTIGNGNPPNFVPHFNNTLQMRP
jgi:TP53 regulating kinase-like protein